MSRKNIVMNLLSKDVQGQRICVISGKFLPTYADIRVNEQSGQIGLQFHAPPTQDADPGRTGSDVVATNKYLPCVATLQWYGPELLGKIYQVKPGDLEFGLGCQFAIKEADLAASCHHMPPGDLEQPGGFKTAS